MRSLQNLPKVSPCQRSRWLRGHSFFANIFAKTKKFAKPVFGARSKVFSKKWSKIWWHCPFKLSQNWEYNRKYILLETLFFKGYALFFMTLGFLGLWPTQFQVLVLLCYLLNCYNLCKHMMHFRSYIINNISRFLLLIFQMYEYAM